MFIKRLELDNFRNYKGIVFEPPTRGVIAIIGDNGQGKTSLLEGIGYLSNKSSFRGANKDVVIRYEQEEAIIRGYFESSKGRELLVEASLSRQGRDKFQINKQTAPIISHDRTIPVTIFTSQDIEVVRGAPALRRDFLNNGVEMLYPKGHSIISTVEKILRQRAVLLKQSGGSISSEVASTLDVWDLQLGLYGEKLVELREQLVEHISPHVSEAYREISSSKDDVSISYHRSWQGSLQEQLYKTRREDIRRQSNGIGPHRDDLEVELNNHPIRHNGSQGEQRTAAYALKVGMHSLYREQIGEDPILLLDDVFSELDNSRSERLLESVIAQQTILTTTGNIPTLIEPALKIRVENGTLVG